MRLSLSTNLNSEARSLRPDPEGEIRVANGIMNRIIEDLQTVPPFNNANFQIAGSLKKNTMLTARNEIDLIVSLPNNIENCPINENTRRNLLAKVAEFYGQPVPASNHQNARVEISGWQVDILLTFRINVVDFLNKSVDERRIFKPYMSLKHVDFVQTRGQKFQELCRLVKYWTNGPEYI